MGLSNQCRLLLGFNEMNLLSSDFNLSLFDSKESRVSGSFSLISSNRSIQPLPFHVFLPTEQPFLFDSLAFLESVRKEEKG